jgi:transglutaminase superfamily protein
MRRVYRREAAFMLVVAQLAVRFVPHGRLFAWADRAPRRIRRFATDEVSWVAWAIDELAATLSVPELPRALAAHAMLRRRGIASRLCLGAARKKGELTTRAWVEVGNDIIGGAADAKRFTRLAAFGQPS